MRHWGSSDATSRTRSVRDGGVGCDLREGASAASRTDRPSIARDQLRLHREDQLDALIAQQTNPISPLYAHFLTPAQVRDRFAPTAAEYAAALTTLRNDGFSIDRTYGSRALADVSAAPAAVEQTFGVLLTAARSAGKVRYVANHRPIIGASLPAVAAVAGVEPDTAQPAATRGTIGATAAPSGGGPVGPDDGFTPSAFAQAYDYPLLHGFNGSGTRIADIVDGSSDKGLATFLRYYQIAPAFPQPNVIPINGGGGQDVYQPDIDTEWLYATAPGAHIDEYDLPDLSNVNIVDAVASIASSNAADVVNISFAACETDETLFYSVEPLIKQSAAEGISIESVAFGGVSYCGPPGAITTQIPADSSAGLAVGGENVIAAQSGASTAASGFVATGGGVSLLVPVPPGQKPIRGVDPRGRNVPDLVLGASINGTGPSYNVYGLWLGGSPFVVNAAAGGLLAEYKQMTGHRLGAFNATIDALFAQTGYGSVFGDVTTGCNGVVSGKAVCAKPGYDITSGIGSVDAFGLGKLLP
jgi:subtilase family serine protease